MPVVKTQEQLDHALAQPGHATVVIKGKRRIPLVIGDVVGFKEIHIAGRTVMNALPDSITIAAVSGKAVIRRVGGHARIYSVQDSATIESLADSAWVTLLMDNATIYQAQDSAAIETMGGSSNVYAATGDVRVTHMQAHARIGSLLDRATVEEMIESARVGHASDRASIRMMRDDSRVRSLTGHATIHHAQENATICTVYSNGMVERLTGYATVNRVDGHGVVHAYEFAAVRGVGDDATVHATAHVNVIRHADSAKIYGGTVIDATSTKLSDPAIWCAHHGVSVAKGAAVLYKALRDDLTGGTWHGKAVIYTVGTNATCSDWEDNNECGGGLHFSPTPEQARRYEESATRYLKVYVSLADLRPITPLSGEAPKCKAPGCYVAEEVDINGEPLTT